MLPILKNSFHQVFRAHFLLLIVSINAALILLLLLLNALSLGESQRIFYDVGLSFLEISHICLVLFLGHEIISKEAEQRTLYLLFVRPISRYNIILWKFLWFSSILVISFFVQLLFIICSFLIFNLPISEKFLMASVWVFLTVEVLFWVLLFFCVVLPRSLIIFATLAVYIIGHSSYSLLEYALASHNGILEYIAKVFVVIFPNLNAINIKNTVGTPIIVDFWVFWIWMLWILAYLLAIGIVTGFIFSRRSFDNV